MHIPELPVTTWDGGPLQGYCWDLRIETPSDSGGLGMLGTWELEKDIRELSRETWLAKIKGTS